MAVDGGRGGPCSPSSPTLCRSRRCTLPGADSPEGSGCLRPATTGDAQEALQARRWGSRVPHTQQPSLQPPLKTRLSAPVGPKLPTLASATGRKEGSSRALSPLARGWPFHRGGFLWEVPSDRSLWRR